MCLILVAWQTLPDTPLVVAANRDEVMSRPTRPAAFWPDAPAVFAGRDLLMGGTWLGVSRDARFAALTNYRDPARTEDNKASRGELAARFLRSSIPPEDFLAELHTKPDRYNGYNILFGDADSLWYYSNIEQDGRKLAPGIYGLSNHLLDTPWPKVARAKKALGEALSALPDRAPLFHLLKDDRPAPDEALPRTGVSLEWERLLSAAFIRAPSYGTRSSTVVVRGINGMKIEETGWREDGSVGTITKACWPL